MSIVGSTGTVTIVTIIPFVVIAITNINGLELHRMHDVISLSYESIEDFINVHILDQYRMEQQKSDERLTRDNLMTSCNAILYKILQYLDLESLESFAYAIDESLFLDLTKSFDLYRKVNPWTHMRNQDPLLLYRGYNTYDVRKSVKLNRRCMCKYCLDAICCFTCWYKHCLCKYRNDTTICVNCL